MQHEFSSIVCEAAEVVLRAKKRGKHWKVIRDAFDSFFLKLGDLDYDQEEFFAMCEV